MAEASYPWTSGTGDGSAYAADDWDTMWEYLFGYTAATEGVLKGVLNALAVTGAATPISINTGAAIVKGKFYKNTAAVTKTIATPVGATRIDRVVLQSVWATQTVRIAVLTGDEGGAAPAVTQTDATKWEISLATISITTLGVITVSDARTYCHFSTEIGAGQIENRTRKLFVPCVGVYNITDGSDVARGDYAGWPLADAKVCRGRGNFYWPSDYVSGATVKAVIYALASGNAYISHSASLGAVGQSYVTHTGIEGLAAVAVLNAQYAEVISIDLDAATGSAGDYVSMLFGRDAVDALDTVGATVWFMGWIVQYTADS